MTACGSTVPVGSGGDAAGDDAATLVDASTEASAIRGVQIVCGSKHACVLYDTGVVRCWGRFVDDVLPPSKPGPFIQIGAGFDVCGLTRSGSLSCWGSHGALKPPPDGFVSINLSEQRACGLIAGGGANCWLINPPDVDPPYIEEQPAPAALEQVRAGGNGPCGLLATNHFPVCWADGSPKPAPPEPLTTLAVGLSFGCGTRGDGTLACWGTANNGELDFPNGAFSDVKAYASSACAQKSDGSLACWGAFGEQQKPITPPGSFGQYCVGDEFGCGIRPDNTVFCWGLNDKGQASPPSDL